MLRNYLTVAIRNLRRQSLYSFVNIAGLGVGMAASLVIFLYVYGEWSHDRHFTNADRIYRVAYSFFNIGEFANGPELLGEYLPAYDVVESCTRFAKSSREELEAGDQVFEDLVYAADASFFEVFQYPFRAGNPSTALARPRSVVLTERAALKFFNTTDVLGRTIAVGKERVAHQVTGVVEDWSHPSHLKATIWISLDFDASKTYYWTSAAFYNYVLLREGAHVADLEHALNDIQEKQIFPTAGKRMGNATLEDYLANENAPRFHVQPLKEIYLRSKLNLEVSAGGNETNVIIFALIGLVILVLASVNFVNLSTARSVRRAKEVGIRKALGTTRFRMVGQFLLESVIVSLLSMVVALGVAELFAFLFFWITGQQLVVDLWSNPIGLPAVVAFAVWVGLASGIYPAFYLTAFKPVAVLKGTMSAGRSGSFRSALVVFQFSISIALMVGTLVIVRQLHFMSIRELGFEEEHVVVIDDVPLLGAHAESFKEELLKQPGVLSASFHTGEPGSKATITMNTFKTGEMENPLTLNTYYGDEMFVDLMGFSLVAGRDFNRDLASDSAAVILNEAAVRALYLAEDPIGEKLNEDQVVIGVVKDFHWESLRNPIAPTAILPGRSVVKGVGYTQLGLKVAPGHAREVLRAAEHAWKARTSEAPLEYHFLDENFGALLAKETVLARAVGFFTALAILISCLGLFGLAAYTTEQRTKEIGIRKVLGASVTHIVGMLTGQFAKLVLISACVAVPVTYYFAQQWLSGFAYRASLPVWVFIAGAAAGLLIAMLTVLVHALRASDTNPAHTLRAA